MMTNESFNQIIKGKKLKIDLSLSDSDFMKRVDIVLSDIGEERVKYLMDNNIFPFSSRVKKRIESINYQPKVTIETTH